MSELLDLPWVEAQSEVAPGEYTAACLRAIERDEGKIHAFLAVESDPEPGSIPIAVKDNIVTRSLPTTCASRLLEGFVSPFDASAVARLRRSGAVVIGKTNLDEFAMGSSTEHSAFGVTRNPWDVTRVPGGSSGGSAAAVAARMVPVALGSETGGSVRQPAAFCGVVGLKPTWGRVSRSGLVAFASGLDQIGVVSKTVGDAAAVLAMIAGRDDLDSTSSPEPLSDYASAAKGGGRGLRFGIVREALELLEGEGRRNFDEAVGVLRAGGAEVRDVSVPSIGQAIAIYYVVANAEASSNLARFDGIRYGRRERGESGVEGVYVASRGAGFGEEVKRRIMLGTFVLSSGYYDAYYGQAQRVRARLRAEFDAVFREADCLLTPTTPEPAFELGAKVGDQLSMYLSDIFTAPANLVGIPALAVPSGFSASGLPLSLQIMAPHFAESLLLRAGGFFERETGWWTHRPAPTGH